MSAMEKTLFVMACVVVPVIWGIVVNRAFDSWRSRSQDSDEHSPVYPDYQI